METTQTNGMSIGGALASHSMPKSVSIEEAANGYVVRLNGVLDFKNRVHIAKDESEVVEIISGFLKSK